MSHLLHRHQENNPRPQETHGDLPEGQWVIQPSIRYWSAVTASGIVYCEIKKKNPIRLVNIIPRQMSVQS